MWDAIHFAKVNNYKKKVQKHLILHSIFGSAPLRHNINIGTILLLYLT